MEQDASMDQSSLFARIESLDAELRLIRRELDQAQRLATLGTMAGSIAHEFNNILTPMLSYAQMALANQGDGDLVAKALRKAMEGALRASSIASSLLGFVGEDGEPMGAEVEAAARAAIGCMAREPARDGVRVILEIEPGLRAALRPVSLQHVLLNLALNAVEAMKPGGGDLTIRANSTRAPVAASNCSTRNNSDGIRGGGVVGSGGGVGGEGVVGVEGIVLIEVADTGRGISHGMMAVVMKPFVTAQAGHEGRRGVGLGLAICRRLVEESGGSIAVESEVGVGTTVRMTLPTMPGEGAQSLSYKQHAA